MGTLAAIVVLGTFAVAFAGVAALAGTVTPPSPHSLAARLEAWREAHGGARDGSAPVRIADVPVLVRLVPPTLTRRTPGAVAEARFVTGRAPAFRVEPRGAPIEAMPTATFVAAIENLSRGTGDFAEGRRLLIAAAHAEPDTPTRFPIVVSDGASVAVSLTAGVIGEAEIDRLASLAASLAASELPRLAVIADALEVVLRIGDDGLVIATRDGEVPLRVTHRPEAAGGTPVTALDATIPREASDLVQRSFRLASPEDAAPRIAARGDASALATLAALEGAEVTFARRGMRISFAELPSAPTLRAAAHAIEQLLVPAQESPFR